MSTNTPPNDPRSYALNAQFFRRMYRLVRPYWTRKGAWKSWTVLTILLASASGFAVLGGYLSDLTAETTNALIGRDHVYWRLMIWMTFIGSLQSSATLFTNYLSGKLLIDWRQWLTTSLMDDYLAKRTYYEIQKTENIDNPDQRIQEEVQPFCQTIIGIPQFILSSLATVGVQSFILMSVSMSMFWAVLIYAVANTGITLWVLRPTIKQNWDLTLSEASLRSGLMHLRNNAENIAFYRGEKIERRSLQLKLTTLAKIKMKIILYYNLRIGTVNKFTELVFSLLPIIFIVPLYFRNEFQYGTIDQASAAAALMLSGLSVINNFIPTLTSTVPNAIRLAEIQEQLEKINDRPQTDDTSCIQGREADSIQLHHLDLYTPGGEQYLVSDLSLSIAHSQHTVIVGQTGVGKSSLLRALAGLWTRGQGVIDMPRQEQLMFIPQRPYMILSDLRSQLLYPYVEAKVDDEHLFEILEILGQPDFIEKHGGLDATKDWRRLLSLGEQQLIAFARILLHRPLYVFLDEATSALDPKTEQQVYNRLSEIGTTFISVGHRESILWFHRQILQLLPNGQWQVSQQTEPQHSKLSLSRADQAKPVSLP